MNWVRLNMRFPGTCIVCGKRINVGEQALWSRGTGVKHIECAEQSSQIACAICGGPAGCSSCELADSCDIKKVSPLCICAKCNRTISSYMEAVAKKFPVLTND